MQNYSPVVNSMAGDRDYENFKVICFLSPLFAICISSPAESNMLRWRDRELLWRSLSLLAED